MSKYSQFFLDSASSVVDIETLEISHPSFSKTYYIVRNAINGVTVTLEDGVTSQAFDYYPLSIKQTGASDDLDQKMQIQLGDLGDVVPAEIDACVADATLLTKPTLIYRGYRSDDLTAPMEGPFIYEITSIAQKSDAAAFNAQAPSLNTSRTGEAYSMDRFPMLAGFL
jgi:hypothetical protein